MFTLRFGGGFLQAAALPALLAAVALAPQLSASAAEPAAVKDRPAKAAAGTDAEMRPYTETISGTSVTFEMIPIPGGVFTMGSPDDEADRAEDEGPQFKAQVEPFWMGKHEVRWDEYDIWSFNLDVQRRKIEGREPTPLDLVADAVTRPTKPYVDMTFDMGHEGYPAICMTHHAAKMYCQWLSAKTGHYYRLPTEAEWEYACRAGTTTAYSFGDDPDDLDDYAWHYGNTPDGYQPVGKKKPNPWGLHDIHGNVAEWVLDQYVPDYSAYADQDLVKNPLVLSTREYPNLVRGGSWDDDPEQLRSAARMPSTPDWKIQDPQLPKSIWFFTDALHVGFRVVRPLNEPSDEEKARLAASPYVPENADEN